MHGKLGRNPVQRSKGEKVSCMVERTGGLGLTEAVEPHGIRPCDVIIGITGHVWGRDDDDDELILDLTPTYGRPMRVTIWLYTGQKLCEVPKPCPLLARS